MQDEADTHATEMRRLSLPVGLGLDTIVQCVPSVVVWTNDLSFDPSLEYPTAVHDVVEVHDTDSREFPPLPVFGLGTIVQVEPFHTCTNVCAVDPSMYQPTAVHEDAETHDTEANVLLPAPVFGLGTIVTVFTTAPAGVDDATPASTNAMVATTANSDLRTIMGLRRQEQALVPADGAPYFCACTEDEARRAPRARCRRLGCALSLRGTNIGTASMAECGAGQPGRSSTLPEELE